MSAHRGTLFRLSLAILMAAVLLFLVDASPAGTVSNKYARVKEFTSGGNITGVMGNIWTGAPDPVPPGDFSNQTLWAVDEDACYGGTSWVETGWTKKGTDPIKFKFIYKVPGQFNCQYVELLNYGQPSYNTTWNYRLEWCSTCGSDNFWYWYLNDTFRAGVRTGWKYADNVRAGGEVSYSGVGMMGAVSAMKYKVYNSWINFDPDNVLCNYGYTLIYNGGVPYNIFDWGYDPPGSCP